MAREPARWSEDGWGQHRSDFADAMALGLPALSEGAGLEYHFRAERWSVTEYSTVALPSNPDGLVERGPRTHGEWLAWKQAVPLLLAAAAASSLRRLRLFAAACVRLLAAADRKSTVVARAAWAAEEYAEGRLEVNRLVAVSNACTEAAVNVRGGNNNSVLLRKARECGAAACWLADWERGPDGSAKEGAGESAAAAVNAQRCAAFCRPLTFDWPGRVRCAFPSPFRPPPHVEEAACLANGRAAVGIAARIYDDRDFAALPVLADALEEGGCVDSELLGHCRGPADVHARGCWALDLVLGLDFRPAI